MVSVAEIVKTHDKDNEMYAVTATLSDTGKRVETKTIGYKGFLERLGEIARTGSEKTDISVFKKKDSSVLLCNESLTKKQLSVVLRKKYGFLGEDEPQRNAVPVDTGFALSGSRSSETPGELRLEIRFLQNENERLKRKIKKQKAKINRHREEAKGLGEVALESKDLAKKIAEMQEELLAKETNLVNVAKIVYKTTVDNPEGLSKVASWVTGFFEDKEGGQPQPQALPEHNPVETSRENEINRLLSNLVNRTPEQIARLTQEIEAQGI